MKWYIAARIKDPDDHSVVERQFETEANAFDTYYKIRNCPDFRYSKPFQAKSKQDAEQMAKDHIAENDLETSERLITPW